ncbi:MAG: methyltransferase domain-containing protein [Nitrospiraceae bacterium]|nr:MAG: methyltransferase domain-containing protein [Nitrospiraceae bacterium]
MAIQYELSYTSRLGRHRHIQWTSEQYSKEHVFVPVFKKAFVLTLPLSSFNQNLAPLKYGRFYPAQIVKTSSPLPAGLFRITGIDGMEFTADFNHPLAGKDSNLEKIPLQSESPPVGKPHMLLEWAGMDVPLQDRDTDYSIDHAFHRQDSTDDALFYENPRKVMHVDTTCISRIKALYENLVKPHDTVLDLMSSWRSHLPPQAQRVTGLGMNADEMADNPMLEEYVVHNLNRGHRLPFNDGIFDAVVNTVSIEYLTEPHQVFSDVRRVLKPGGRVIVTFSNRYFPPKTTRFWAELHPAERPGWVLQLLRTSGFEDLYCQVERGLGRSQDDRYAGQVEDMDPLFAVWGKAGMM